MTDRYLPPPPDQHDTAAYARQVPPAAGGYGPAHGQGQPGYGPGAGARDWYVAGQAATVGNPEADYWASRFRRQRTWTRIMAGVVALGALVLVGVGFAALQAVRSDPLASAAAQLGDSLGALPDQAVPAPSDGGDAPDGALPGAPDEQQRTAPDPQDGSGIPLPEPLQGLGSALGITDVRQLLDLAVANGMMSQEDADKVRAALEAGKAIQGLTESFGDTPAES